MRLAFGMRLGIDKAWDRQDTAFGRRVGDQERARSRACADQAYARSPRITRWRLETPLTPLIQSILAVSGETSFAQERRQVHEIVMRE
jgi:hypothetical protein